MWVGCVLEVEDILEFKFGVITQTTVQGVVGRAVLQELRLDHVDVEVWCLQDHRFFGLYVLCQGAYREGHVLTGHEFALDTAEGLVSHRGTVRSTGGCP